LLIERQIWVPDMLMPNAVKAPARMLRQSIRMFHIIACKNLLIPRRKQYEFDLGSNKH
jgi:hypothetical protein